MKPELHVHRRESLPPMAWCARLDAAGRRVDLTCGPWVDTGSDWFFEGAWAGDFGALGFERASERFGSGGRLVDGGLLLAPTSHTLDRLYLVRRPEAVFSSNSLAFLLESAGLELDVRYPHYLRDFWSVIMGAQRCARRIPTRAGPHVELVYAEPVRVGPHGARESRPAPALPGWTDFAAYRRYMAGSVTALFRNAADLARRHTFDPVVAMSTGYDSTCCAVLASEAGCSRVLTFPDGKAYLTTKEILDDSAEQNARRLGMEPRVVEYRGWQQVPEPLAAEFAACGDAFDLRFAVLADDLPGAVLVTGTCGGMAWDLEPERPFDRFSCKDPSSTSLEEFRLHTGFVHAPVPLIGISRRADTYRVTHAPEMAPFSLGGSYDRPIARRIIEEAGIPRGAFAREKLGSFDAIIRHPDEKSPYPGLERFCEEHRDPLRGWRALRLRLERSWSRTRARHGPARSRFVVARGGRPALLVPWGNSVVRSRYREGLGSR